MSSEESVIYYAQGYLKAISRLSNEKAKISIDIFDIGNDLDESIESKISKWRGINLLKSKSEINYEQIKCFLKQNIYHKLSNLSACQIKAIDWDLQELFGLISTSLDTNNVFHPLVSNGGYLLEIASENFRNLKALVVLLNKHAVILSINEGP